MEALNAQIVQFKNTNYFIYNNDKVKVYPTKVESGSTSITAILPTDIVVELDDYDMLVSGFTSLGFVMRDETNPIIEKPWHLSGKTIQVFLTHSSGTKLIIENPDLVAYMKSVGIPTIYENDGIYIYLEELYEEHRLLFMQYGAEFNEKSNEIQEVEIIE